jgi:hypothetical protein
MPALTCAKEIEMTRKGNRKLTARASFPARILTILALAVVACGSVVPAAAQGSSLQWQQLAELLPSDPGSFGGSVAVDGSVAVVGAPSMVVGPYGAGAAYIFVNNGGVWTQQARLTPEPGQNYDAFGYAVAISGNTVVVGAYGETITAGSQGAAYVFVNNGGTWTQEARLTPQDAAGGDSFGFSVSVKGDTMIVGAPFKNFGALVQEGAAYVFTNSGGTWTQQGELIAADGQYSDRFGYAVAVDGDNAIVGTPFKQFNSNLGAGMGYVFARNNGAWSQYVELIPPDTHAGGAFGYSVALSGSTALIGAPNQFGNGPGVGSAYIWQLNFGTWSNSAELTATDLAAGTAFGQVVALDSTSGRLVVGAPYAKTNGVQTGAAYAFALVGGTWTQETELVGADSIGGDGVGNGVAVSGTVMMVDASSHVWQSNAGNGTVYVFDEAPTQLQITQQPAVGTAGSGIDAIVVQLEDAFGNPLSTSGVPVTLASNPAGLSGTLMVNTTNGVAEFDGLSFNDVNTYTLTASAPGLPPATSAPIVISGVPQVITFGALQSQALGTSPFAVSASASSGLPVSFASLTGSVCTVAGNTVSLVATGLCTIEASQAGNTTYAAATPVDQSFQVNAQAQTITFAALSARALGTAPFSVTATASSGLPVTIASLSSSVCSVSASTVTLLATGQCQLEATQAGNSQYAAATPVDQSFQVNAQPQTITFGALQTQTLGTAPFAVSASASSGLPVSFASLTGAVCTVSGNTVSLVATGQCTIEASQAGNASYSAATPVDQSFQVNPAPLQPQTITFGALSSQTLGSAPFAVVASASSGLPVSFASLTTPVCTVAGNTVTLVATGQCTIQTSQSGNSTYAAATPVSQSFQVAPAPLQPQTITFGALSSQTLGSAPFAIVASASSGLPVSFASLTGSVCTVAGNTVSLVATGQCTIQASQAGNSTYAAATPVSQSFQVAPAPLQPQTITFTALPNQTLGTAPFAIVASASSGLPVSFTSLTTAVCTVSGNTVTLLATGQCALQATQAGNSQYAAATPVNRAFLVKPAVKLTQTITFAPLPDKWIGAGPFTVTATASSGLPVTFKSVSAAICSVSGNVVTMLSAGSCGIKASQDGNSTWQAASPVTRGFLVSLRKQTIVFPAITQNFSPTPVLIPVSSNSGLHVTLTSKTRQICTVVGDTHNIKTVAPGTCTLTATQDGDAEYQPATPVTQSFVIGKATPVITFGPIPNQTIPPLAKQGTPVPLIATSTSPQAVDFRTPTPGTCTITRKTSGAYTVTPTRIGVCTVEAYQLESVDYLKATPVDQSFGIR